MPSAEHSVLARYSYPVIFGVGGFGFFAALNLVNRRPVLSDSRGALMWNMVLNNDTTATANSCLNAVENPKSTASNTIDVENGHCNSEPESVVDDSDADVTWFPSSHNQRNDNESATSVQENAGDDSTVTDQELTSSNLVDVETSNCNSELQKESSDIVKDEPKKGKKRRLQEDKWKRNKSKRLRNSGKEYVNSKGIHRHIIGGIAGVFIGDGLLKYRRYISAERDAVILHYMELHPEDFQPEEKKKYKDILQPWTPVR